MEAYRTEEEQLEALRRWWREQGRTTLLIIAVAIAGVFGYRAWTQQQQEQLQQVAAIYQGLLSVDQQLQQGAATPEQRQTARHLAGTLRDEHARTVYARFAALFQAKYAVQDGDIEAAEAALQWVIERKSNDTLAQLANLRLAHLYYSQEDYARTLEVLDSRDAGSYAAAYDALRGDVLYAQGDADGAAQAWQRSSRQAAGLADPLRDPVLQLKLDNVAAEHGPSGQGAPEHGES